MALQMSYTKEDVEYPESYWRIASYTLSPSNKYGKVRFEGYENKAKRDEGKIVLATHEIFITPEIYKDYFAPDELNPEGQNPIKAAYVMAGNNEFFNNGIEV